jgi:LTXXQ motif family protein
MRTSSITNPIAKIAAVAGSAALLVSLAASSALAAKPGPGPGRPAGGAPHVAAPHIAAPAGGVPHMGGGVPHFAAHVGGGPRFATHIGGPRFAPHISAHRGVHFTPHIATRGRGPFGRSHHIAGLGRPTGNLRTNHPALTTNHPAVTALHNAPTHTTAANAPTHTAAANIHGPITPHSFAANRQFAADPAFRPFLGRRWFFHHHYGWIGPWFWPYAYGDFFYYALWPYEYADYDPFWYYGYDDIYEGIFQPYDYTEYVQGSGASARMSHLTQAVAQSCTDEAAEVTGWPIDQIQAAVQPNPQQTSLLDNLGNAIVQASDIIKSHCPSSVAFTPVDRLAQMQTRLEALVQAVNIVQPALAKFYDSLSDEQKARFNEIGVENGKQPSPAQQQAANPQAACGENVMAFPIDQIDRTVQPSDTQHSKLQALDAASGKAADLIKASCPSQVPATPPDRLAAEGAHLQAMLQGVQTIRPALDDFYNSLSDEQKARFNTLGRQLFAEE